ncbi:hypothetical protein ACFQ3Z_42805 [Streptomyces nogalater]
MVRLVRGENAYSSGQSDDSLYLVEEGQVKTVSDSPDGKRCLLSIRVEGSSSVNWESCGERARRPRRR